MEVAQHVGDNTVRCVMLSGSDGLYRGMQVLAPGKTIEVPVGEQTLGKLHVYHRTGDLYNGTCFHLYHTSFLRWARCALAPADTSVISWVMAA